MAKFEAGKSYAQQKKIIRLDAEPNIKINDKLKEKVRQANRRLTVLRKKAPYSPALREAEKFLSMTNAQKFDPNKIRTIQQYTEFEGFVKRFLKNKTSKVTAAKQARMKQVQGVVDIFKRAGINLDTKKFFEKFDQLNIYILMQTIGYESDRIIQELATIQSKSPRANSTTILRKFLQQNFGDAIVNQKYSVFSGFKTRSTKKNVTINDLTNAEIDRFINENFRRK